MSEYSLKPLSSVCGAEIRGINFDHRLTAEMVATLRQALLKYLVLVFRCGKISEDTQIGIAQHFGPTIGARSALRKDGGDRRLMVISNVRENGEPIGALPDGELMFHSDSVFLQKPLLGALLYAEEVPSTGGNTLFANMYQAYDSLSEAVKSKISNLKAVHAYDYETSVKKASYNRSSAPFAQHPVVRTHPETGRKALYVNRLMTEELVGLPANESKALLEILFAHAERSEHVYEHVWKREDLVFWDNRCTQHARTNFPSDERRLLRRVGIEGDTPF